MIFCEGAKHDLSSIPARYVLVGNSRIKITSHPREDPGTAVISSMGDTAGIPRIVPNSININKQNSIAKENQA
jgi:hypothetical protein